MPAIGDAAIGTVMTSHWNPDFDHPRNKDFIKAYIAKYNHYPSLFAVGDKSMKKGREMVFERKDSFWEKCPEAKRQVGGGF